jgi:O-antigen/teichoic acid export membrane protein
MICLIMSSTVYNVLFPTLSTIQGDTEKSVRAYVKIIEYVAILSILYNLVLFSVSQDFLVYVLGKGTDKWMPSLMSLKILCIYGVARSLLEAISTFFTAKGLAGIVLKANLMVALLELVFVYPAVVYGSIEVVAVVVLIAYFAAVCVYMMNLHRIGLSLRDLWKPLQSAILSLIVSAVLYFSAIQFLNNGIIFLFIKAAILTVIYVLTYCILTKFEIAKQLLNRVKQSNESIV